MRSALFICLVAFATCQPDHDHHGPGGDHIHDEYKFDYNDKLGYMILDTSDGCYLWKLADSDVANLKDPTALKALEMKMFGMMGDLSNATELDHHSIPHELGPHCEHHKVFELTAASSTTN